MYLLCDDDCINSHGRYKEGVQGEVEAVAGDQRKAVQKGIPTPGAYVPIDHFRQRIRDTREMRKDGQWYGVATGSSQ